MEPAEPYGVEVIADPERAVVALDPARSRLLAALGQPASAAELAGRLGVPRQKINYHLRTLEDHGLVRVADTRKWGGITERRLVASARGYAIAAEALGPAAVGLGEARDRLSASYLVALASRLVSEVGALWNRAADERKRLATLAIDAEVHFRSAADRAAFTSDLTEAIARVIARHHCEGAPGGRTYRLVVAAHPLPHTRSRHAH